ncbi:helix-turn-helix domain-containing protein [Rhizobium rhizogenes]|uniref:helix-turn-helix domain-containing protein n=1 Tax=Rhizobium rhizogenes TaxID=359 RepID=UPI001573ACB6|nr:helix-turn-helix domain-containing protein [Rhizobium rhizogenes]NTI27643.1 helix-turn-helix domain-containing protein [Rhizobium rhizogenes]
MPSTLAAPIEYQLTSSESRVYAHLASRDLATKQSIMMALYSDRPDDEPEIKIVDVFVCKLRKKLTRFGVLIETVWGQGYRLAKQTERAA